MRIKVLTIALWAVWTVITVLILASRISSLEITNGIILWTFIYMFVLGATCLFTRKLVNVVAISFSLFLSLLIFKLFTDWRGDWKTQTVIYQNKNSSNRTIEFQLQDKGALGYNRRTVDRFKITFFLSWTKRLSESEVSHADPLKWEKMNVEKNEQELKGG